MALWLPPEKKEKPRHPLWWMFVAFAGTSVGTLTYAGSGLNTQALEGADAAQVFAVYSYLALVGTLTSCSLLVRHGTVYDERTRQRTRRYPVEVYLPWRGGLSWRYALAVGMGLCSGVVFQFSVAAIANAGQPTGIANVLSWAQNVWLALWALGELRHGFTWTRLATPLVGLVQLVGVCITVGFVRLGGPVLVTIDWDMLSLPVVFMFGASMVNAGLKAYLQYLKKHEGKVFLARMVSTGATEEEAKDLLSGKVMTYPSLYRFFIATLALVVSVAVQGWPRVTDPGLLALAFGLLTLGCFGNRAVARAMLDGDKALSGIGSTAALGTSFFWNAVIQKAHVLPMHIVGSLVTLLSGMLSALLETREQKRKRRAAEAELAGTDLSTPTL